MLMPLGANPADAKVQKWLADQMGVTPDRPITPGSSSTATSKRPASTSSASGGGWAEWMTKLSGEEHVTVFNRVTGKRLSGQDGPKLMYPMTAAMLGLGDPKNPMKMDPMMMAALSMDPKTLQAMGIDPKKLTALAQPTSSSKSSG